MKMRTALVRLNGNLEIKRYDDYRTNKEFAEDLRANGYRVLKVWAKDVPDHEVEEWEFMNRKATTNNVKTETAEVVEVSTDTELKQELSVVENKTMTAYDSYLSTFPPKPEYQREVLYPWYDDKPLYTTLKERGVLVESKKLTAKILSAADGAVSFDMANGGMAETMSDKYTGDVVLVVVPPDQVPVYRKYQAPLPYWAWCAE